MIAVDIGDDKHGIAAELHAALAEDVRCIMADKLAVDDILAVLLMSTVRTILSISSP